MWFNKRDNVAIVLILVQLYFGFKVIYVEVLIFKSKDIERHVERNREGSEYALGHPFKLVEGQDN